MSRGGGGGVQHMLKSDLKSKKSVIYRIHTVYLKINVFLLFFSDAVSLFQKTLILSLEVTVQPPISYCTIFQYLEYCVLY